MTNTNINLAHLLTADQIAEGYRATQDASGLIVIEQVRLIGVFSPDVATPAVAREAVDKDIAREPDPSVCPHVNAGRCMGVTV